MLSKTPDYDRLKLVSQVHDGFELSEHDLTVRGAGHLLGYQQSGHKGLKLNNFLEDYEIFMFVKNLKQFE
jgi:RecG-like helicase